MDHFRARLVITLLALGFIGGGLIGILLYYVFPTYYSQWYVGSLLFLLIVETLIILYTESSSRTVTAKQMTNVYLATKVVKMLLSLAYVGVYAAIEKEEIKSFVLTFIILYLLFLFIEMFLFMKIEKHLKGKKQ